MAKWETSLNEKTLDCPRCLHELPDTADASACTRTGVVTLVPGSDHLLVSSWPVDHGESESNLVDSASSHTLVSKIKPCMSKYKYFTLKLRTAHYISYNLFDSPLLLG